MDNDRYEEILRKYIELIRTSQPTSTGNISIKDLMRKTMEGVKDKLDCETVSRMHSMQSLPLAKQKAEIRETLTHQCATDCNLNDIDPL